MREIKLSGKCGAGKVALVDDEDYARVIAVGSWQADADRHVMYAVCSRVKMHRLVLGVTDPKIEVDHRDNDGLNNVRSNLRIATKSQNAQNRSFVRGKSRYKGVTWNTKRSEWRANIFVNGHQKFLGAFPEDREQEAARAYDTAARCYFGEFAHLNFPTAIL
jgi:HNH endonuclease/AP2 domain